MLFIGVGAGIDNSHTKPLGFATEHETDFVFAEPFVKTNKANSLWSTSREKEKKNRDKENELAVCENHVYRLKFSTRVD